MVFEGRPSDVSWVLQPLFPGASGGMDDPNIPLPALMELLEKYPDVVAVVSFCGFPDVLLNNLPEEEDR